MIGAHPEIRVRTKYADIGSPAAYAGPPTADSGTER